MDHGLPIETRVRDDLLRLARDLDLPMVATNDLHYTHADDADAHEALLCVQSGKTLADPNRLKFDARDFYLKSPAEMRSLWEDKYDLREACDNTLLIAERCDVTFDESANYMPRFPVPEGETEQSWFVKRGRARAASAATRAASPSRCASGPTTRPGSSPRWASPATSWWSPTSSTGPRRTASGSAPAAAPGRVDRRVRDAHHRPRPVASTG